MLLLPLPPVDAESPPVDAESPPVGGEPPPVDAESPPVDAESPPVAAEAPPVGGEAPPPDCALSADAGTRFVPTVSVVFVLPVVSSGISKRKMQ